MISNCRIGIGLALLGLAAPALAQESAAGAPARSANRGLNDEQNASEQIVITGTRTERLQRDAPVRTDVIGETVLRLAAPRNLADALEYLPGARAESNCQNCNTVEIQLLGLPGAYNQILFDSLPLLSGVAAVYGVEQIPAVLIDRIEVVKGGASVLYGPGAVAGVVNVIPRRIGETGVRGMLGHERIRGEPFSLASVAATYAWGEAGSGVTGYGHVEDAAPVDHDGDGFTELVDRRLVIGGARGRLALGERSTLLFEYQYTDEFRRGGNRLDQPEFLANVAESIDTRFQRGSLSLQRELTESIDLIATYAFAHVDRDTFYGGLGDVEADPDAPGFNRAAFDAASAISRNQYGTTDDTLHYAELRGEAGIGRHTLIGGVQYRHERVDDRNVDVDGAFVAQLAKGSFDDLGLFVQDEWSLRDDLRLVLGGRVDFSSELDHPVFSPRIGLWYSPSEALVLRANVSTGFRAPEIFSEDLHVDTLGAAPVRIRNAPGLSEERSVSIALGFDWRPRDGAFTLDGQAYYTSIKDTLFLGEIKEDADGALFRVRSNAGGSIVAGGELTANLRASERLSGSLGLFYINARYQDSQIVFEDETGTLVTERYLKSPRFGAIGQLLFQPFDRLQGFLALRHVDRMRVLNNRTGEIVDTPSFVVADLSLTRHFDVGRAGGDLDLTLGVKNILDERQRDIEMGANRDSDYVYGPRQARTFFVRLNAAF